MSKIWKAVLWGLGMIVVVLLALFRGRVERIAEEWAKRRLGDADAKAKENQKRLDQLGKDEDATKKDVQRAEDAVREAKDAVHAAEDQVHNTPPDQRADDFNKWYDSRGNASG